MAITIPLDQLGAELKRRRDADELSLRDVERETGISTATLSRIERGSKPEFAVIERLAQWLGVNVVAAGEETSVVRTDDDLKRTIAVHLRANKKLPEDVAASIVESFDVIMQIEIQKAKARDQLPS
ncbi:MAG: helix-turn-helix domain-containing protein [Gemmatimonadetes bacterium]|nr:helix-turn-helix domain-containing protein [Gemmatimonadota bacterium]